MHKWYEDDDCDRSVILASQVCLLRNVEGLPFAERMDPMQTQELIDTVTEAAAGAAGSMGILLEGQDLTASMRAERAGLIAALTLPPRLLGSCGQARLLTGEEDRISILIGGTEHICIQVSCPGSKLQDAYQTARRLDEEINRKIRYSFSSQYGFLTASPLYTGTGLAASCYMHLPFLEKAGGIDRAVTEAKKAGCSLQAHFHGKVQSPGEVYSVRNISTLGISEHEILAALSAIAGRLALREDQCWEELAGKDLVSQMDQMFRAYGLVKYARILGGDESLELLSSVRSGYLRQIWESDVRPPLFAMMIGSQKNVLKKRAEAEKKSIQYLRAEMIRERLPQIRETDQEEQ